MYIIKKLSSFIPGNKSVERWVPELEPEAPYARPHLERYKFALSLVEKNDSVLDISCGAGYGTDMLYDYCKNAIGIDRSKEAIGYAKKHYRGNFFLGDIFEDTTTSDVVVSFETIEHLDPPLEFSLKYLAGKATRLFIGSVPYREKPGNPFHTKFNISVEDLETLRQYGNLDFYYQEHEPGYKIYPEIDYCEKCQNVIFTLTKA